MKQKVAIEGLAHGIAEIVSKELKELKDRPYMVVDAYLQSLSKKR